MRSRLAILIVIAVAWCPVWLVGQTPAAVAPSTGQDGTPVFRSGVEAVRFEAVVTDKHGNPVTDLTADDFEVREDEVVQTVQQFSRVLLPLPRPHPSLGETSSPRSDIAANDESQDRLYVFVLDEMRWVQAVRSAKMVRRFLDDYFSDSDLAAVVTLDRSGAMHFTNDRSLLMDQVNAFAARMAALPPWPPPPSPALVQKLEPYDEAHDRANQKKRIIADKAAIFGEIGRRLAHIDARRKSILYISMGLEFDPYDAVDTPTSTFSEDARTALEPIIKGNLTVYPFYPGVQGPLTLRTMRALAYVTGAVPTGADVTRAFNQIVHDNSAYYVLGYQSTNPRLDGGFRRIHVEVKRKGLKVRTRSGYFVDFPVDPNADRLFAFNGRLKPPAPFIPPSDLTPALTEAMDSPVPLTAVPMKLFATALKADSRNDAISVVVEIPASGLDLTEKDGALTGQVDVAIGATTGLRTIRGTGFTYDISVRGEERERFLTHGLRLAAEVPLEPGDYRLHVAAGSRGGRIGKALHDITVPDFSKPLLIMSAASLTTTTAAEMPTRLSTTTRATALPGPPTASRLFARADTIVFYTEVYENVWWTDTEHTITVTTELRDADDRAVPMTSERRSTKTPRLADGGYGFTARIPLAGIAPGAYTLRLQAHSDFDQPQTVSHEVPIQVR